MLLLLVPVLRYPGGQEGAAGYIGRASTSRTDSVEELALSLL
jgi:hypothetical protein